MKTADNFEVKVGMTLWDSSGDVHTVYALYESPSSDNGSVYTNFYDGPRHLSSHRLYGCEKNALKERASYCATMAWNAEQEVAKWKKLETDARLSIKECEKMEEAARRKKELEEDAANLLEDEE